MPAHDGVGLDDAENVSPSKPSSRKRDPEGAIERSQSRLNLLVCVGGELLAQRQLDDRLLAAASEEGADTDKDDRGVCK